jgi:hypothetical protein
MGHSSVPARTRLLASALIGGLILAAAAVTFGATGAEAGGERQSVAAVPDGFQQYLTYMAQPREVDEPTVVNYATFRVFQAEVYGRDDAALAAYRQEAIAFYAERFGLDFSDAPIAEDGSQSIDGATLVPSFVAPEREYRAYTIGGERVPSEGYVVRDSGFNVMLTEGVTLHGEYGGSEGRQAPASLLAFGEYNILIPGPGNSGNDREILIAFRSTGPIFANADGTMVFVCDIESEQWGSGQARGIVTANGEIRNVLTFPAVN